MVGRKGIEGHVGQGTTTVDTVIVRQRLTCHNPPKAFSKTVRPINGSSNTAGDDSSSSLLMVGFASSTAYTASAGIFGAEHFPINVEEVAREFTHQRFPNDPITLVAGDVLPGFDGALVRDPTGKKGWGIIYNKDIASRGRINFTLAHEFGHYLLHRVTYPNGFQCGQQDVARWDSQYKQLENQANEFAANLLMPLDDYRRQINPQDQVNLDVLAHCADRYKVSLIAATLRWLEFTERRAVLVVSRDGYILWARSSNKALKTGAFFRTSRDPIPIPDSSIAAQRDTVESPRAGTDLPAGVWFGEPCQEMTVFSEQYDFTISVLQLANDSGNARVDEDDEESEDLFDRIRRNHGLK